MNVYKKIIFNVLTRFDAGHLELTDEHDRQFIFGDPNAPPDAQIRVVNEEFYRRLFLSGDIGLGEAFEFGDWETPDVAKVIRWFIMNIENSPAISGTGFSLYKLPVNAFFALNRLIHKIRHNSPFNSKTNISYHYDMGNSFFESFLDPTMTYSSALFTEGTDLEKAQVQKLRRITDLIRLKDGDRILEIGSGWGSFAEYAVEHFNADVTGITLSKEQRQYADDRLAKKNTKGKAAFLLQDYRHINGVFDKIVSIEMLEAVGHKYLDVFFKKCHDALHKNGIIAIQTITFPDSRYQAMRKSVDWIQKYIFPGGELPSVKAIIDSLHRVSDLQMYSLKDMGRDYALTLREWLKNFNCPTNRMRREMPPEFVRRWNYYLSYCLAAFETRNITVCQIQIARPNNPQL